MLVRRHADGSITDVVAPGFNVRSRVHEYGGGAYLVADGIVYFSNFADQRVYKIDGTSGAAPLTQAGKCFYADFAFDRHRQRLICVREDHSQPGEPVNTLVAISVAGGESAGEVIASGYDFYSTPRIHADGSKLAWLSWRHPDMPWDATELWVADIGDGGALVNSRLVAGGPGESIYQPGWSPDGSLCFVSDRDGWWRLYTQRGPVLRDPPEAAEFGRPQWVFGTATWACVSPTRMVAAYTQRGRWHLADIDVTRGTWRRVDTNLEPHEWLAADAESGTVVLVAASATAPDAVVSLSLDSNVPVVVCQSSTLQLADADISIPESIEFPSTDGTATHAFYYPPANRDYSAPASERPPLIAISHGGPTTATAPTLDLKVQYWTSRGFAVVDVNYSGSSGYGRAYRERLNGRWGVADVEDMVNAATYLVAAGLADEDRLAIRGGSAGGYTTLAALTFYPGVFKAGASYYGISDIEVLAHDTHKFESRYLDRLVAPYPEGRDIYRARSPIHFIDRLASALILFQGLEDKVVPPNQSEMMAAAARAKGLPVAYLAFEGEQHGFRKAETIVRCLEAELYFYGVVFGFEPADVIQPIDIANI